MLDSEGHVAEGSGQNLFVVKNGAVRTPAAYAGILKGVTRDVVIDLGRQAGLRGATKPRSTATTSTPPMRPSSPARPAK